MSADTIKGPKKEYHTVKEAMEARLAKYKMKVDLGNLKKGKTYSFYPATGDALCVHGKAEKVGAKKAD